MQNLSNLLVLKNQRRLRRLFPFLIWLPLTNTHTFRADFSAALIGAAIMLPQGVAFASIAGMPPQYGLYAGMIPAIIAALFGSSWHLVSGPTTAASVVLFSALSSLAVPGSAEYVQLALTLTLIVGIFQLLMGLARMGVLVNFISHTVIVGFTAGAALLIIVSQLKHFIGIAIPRDDHAYQTLYHTGEHLIEANVYAVIVGCVTLLTGVVAKKRYPRQAYYMLVALVCGSLTAWLFNYSLGPEVTNIAVFGALPAMLPPLSVPILSFNTIEILMPAALAMTLLALTEAVSIARSLAIRSGQNLDGNQEFIGQGLSNISASFFSGYVATGSFNRSAINYAAGARTPLSAILGALLLMTLVLFVAPLTAYLPHSAMAGLLFLVAWGLIDFHHIKKIIRTSRAETAVLIATFAATLLVDLEFAILLGVILNMALFMMNTTRPRMYSRLPDRSQPNSRFNTLPGVPECPQLKILRLDGSLYFGSVYHIQKILGIFRQREFNQKHLLLISYSINQIDISGAEFLSQEAERRRAEGGGLYLYKPKEHVVSFLRRGDYMNTIGEDNHFVRKQIAIATIFDKLDHSICARCKRRVFLECEQFDTTQQEEQVSKKEAAELVS